MLIQTEALRKYRKVASAARLLDEAGYHERAQGLRDAVLAELWPELTDAEREWVEGREL